MAGKHKDPCPFCGDTKPFVVKNWDTDEVCFRCQTCGARGPVGRNTTEASDLWNWREGKASE